MIQRTGVAAKLPFQVHPHMLRHSTGYKCKRRQLTIAAAYGGHDEITDAVRALLCGAATLFRDRERDVTAQLVVGDSKNTITLARSSADVSPPYGFMLLPGTTSSGFAMKRSSFSLSHTKSAPFMALE
jgi:hypothetical protein